MVLAIQFHYKFKAVASSGGNAIFETSKRWIIVHNNGCASFPHVFKFNSIYQATGILYSVFIIHVLKPCPIFFYVLSIYHNGTSFFSAKNLGWIVPVFSYFVTIHFKVESRTQLLKGSSFPISMIAPVLYWI